MPSELPETSDAEALRFARLFCAVCQEIAPKEDSYPLLFSKLYDILTTHLDITSLHGLKGFPLASNSGVHSTALHLSLLNKRGLILLHTLGQVQVRGDGLILKADFENDRVDDLYDVVKEVVGAYLAQVLPTKISTMPPPKQSVLAT